jgi:glycosyltransferase involved in cell wall biosynthesis
VQDNSAIKQKFKALKCCVLLPTYNNSKTLENVIADVLQYTDDVCVVNDGSTDSTPEILSKFPQLKILDYQPNKGKGWALQQGFLFAAAQGYEYAISMDTDGQHYAEDLPVLLHALEHNANAIIIGARNMDQAHIPGKSNFGRKFSNFWFRFETGIDAPDTQSGYRLYPLNALNKIQFFTKKFEFEVEVIVRGAWSGLDVLSVPVKVYYPPAHERVSHFRPLRDFSRISVLNTCLVTWLFVWILPRNFFRWIKKKTFGKS